MIRLEPMSESEFGEAMERAIARHAANAVLRGHWTEAASQEASRREMARFYPEGVATPGRVFATVVDAERGSRVGETWYIAQEEGGKVRFWVDWISIDPPFRRRGFATQVLERLAEIAVERGADRMGLYVFLDNPGALALYTKVGFVPQSLAMVRPLSPRS